MPTKIELTLEQSQQGVSNDVLVSIEGVEELKRNMIVDIEESRHGPSDAMHNPSQPFGFLSKETCGSLLQPPITKTKSAQIESRAKKRSKSYALSWKPCQGDSLNLPDHRAQVDQGSQIKMIQVKEMMQDNDLKNSKSKDKGSKSRSQSMDEQSHYKQDKTITRQSINVKRHIFNVIGGTEEFEERDLNIGGDC
ncbi:hypothetical protein Tco_0876854 [Tanacetum coccineum]|uniref:Uncharacterized protein n=1 Tax=Tanacetum coccineum TaxID=301880 RepID=A0ABQ5BWM6_9ASTR